MCWKWRYSCGHVADIRCRAPIKNPNDPEDADLAYYCKGLPSDYTDAHVPCQKCLIKESPARDEKDKGGNKGGNGGYGGGNTSHEAERRAEGWINVNALGIFPWEKPWMPSMIGMKYNEKGYIVNDPDSTVRYYTMVIRQDTHTFDSEADYDNLTHDLEALSNNAAYANMEYEVELRKPMDAARQYYIRNLGPPAYGPIPTPATSPVREISATPSLSPASSRSVSPVSIFDTTTDLGPDTPASQLSFNYVDVFATTEVPVDEDFNNFRARLVAADARYDSSITI